MLNECRGIDIEKKVFGGRLGEEVSSFRDIGELELRLIFPLYASGLALVGCGGRCDRLNMLSTRPRWNNLVET